MKCLHCKHTVQVDFDKWICDLEHKEVYEGVDCSRFPIKSLLYNIKDFVKTIFVKRQYKRYFR
jgi:hypothetical protein